MPSPFPGVNPYLEDPALWSGVHHWLITEIARSLNPQLRPEYFVAVEERVYEVGSGESTLIGIPDDAIIQMVHPAASMGSSTGTIAVSAKSQPISVRVPMPEEVTEGYLEVRQVGTGEVITVIELLSPKNKRSGKGRQQYEAKRETILGSQTHLIEIDLLRQWQPMLLFGQTIASHYRILVSRSHHRPHADLYPFNLSDTIPTFALPLKVSDRDPIPEPIIDLHILLNQVYEQGGYDLRIDYAQDPVPALDATSVVWLDDWLKQQGLR